MEVLIHQVNREVVVEQPQAWRPDGGCGSESAANGGGIGFSGPVNVVKNDSFGLSEESSRVYSDVEEGNNSLQWPLLEKNLKVDEIDIPKLIKSIINTQNPINNLKDKFIRFPENKKDRISHAQNEQSLKIDLVEESDEEVVELEFVRAVDKIHTHTPYCPNCSSQITKVILRRKKRQLETAPSADHLAAPRPANTLHLFGCLSCFSIFIPSGNVLNRFRLFGAKGKNESARSVGEEHAPDVNLAAEPGASADGSTTVKQRNVLNPFRQVGIEGKHESARIVGDEHAPTDVNLAAEPRAPIDGSMTIKQGKNTGENNGEFRHVLLDAIVPIISGHPVHQSGHSAKDESPKPGNVSEIAPTDESLPSNHLTINVGDGTENIVERGSDALASEPVEIVKCMVYGGLMELITSLSIVSSAVASGVSTLNILGLGLATLISGMFVFGHNLVELKNDTSERNSDERQIDRYQELLGNRRHFLLHAAFAILSFLIFGLVPPVVYAFTFYESDNKDYKILAVAAASFTCIVVLAAAQAYVRGTQKASDYVKVAMYYVTAAVAASGVAYAAGDLIRMLMERLGWFGAGTPTVAGASGTAAWASY